MRDLLGGRVRPPPIEPIGEDTLIEFCRFLVANLSRERSPEAWRRRSAMTGA